MKKYLFEILSLLGPDKWKLPGPSKDNISNKYFFIINDRWCIIYNEKILI